MAEACGWLKCRSPRRCETCKDYRKTRDVACGSMGQCISKSVHVHSSETCVGYEPIAEPTYTWAQFKAAWNQSADAQSRDMLSDSQLFGIAGFQCMVHTALEATHAK